MGKVQPLQTSHSKGFKKLQFQNCPQPWWRCNHPKLAILTRASKVAISNSFQTWWRCNHSTSHFKAFKKLQFQNFLQPWWRYKHSKLALQSIQEVTISKCSSAIVKVQPLQSCHFRAFKKLQFQNFPQPWWKYKHSKLISLKHSRSCYFKIFFNHGEGTNTLD